MGRVSNTTNPATAGFFVAEKEVICMKEINKNYIPENVLEEASGDPRVAFGLMANEELDAMQQTSKRRQTIEMKANEEYVMQSPKDV